MKKFLLTRRNSRPESKDNWPSGSQIRLGQDEDVLYTFISPQNERLGVRLNGADGNIEVGGWDEKGGWTKLVPMVPCPMPTCQYLDNHASIFPLDQHQP